MRSSTVVTLLCICVAILAYRTYKQDQEIVKLHQAVVTAEKGGGQRTVAALTESGTSSQRESESLHAGVSLEKKVTEQRAEIKQLRSMLADLRSRMDQSETQPEAKAENQGNPRDTSPMSSFMRMMEDPDTRDVIREQHKMGLTATYGDLFRGLNLTDDELDELKYLIVDKQMDQMELLNDPELRDSSSDGTTRMAVIKEEYDERIRLVLGEQNYGIYRYYEDTLPDRMQVNLYKQQLSTGDRLTDRQEDDLIAAMYGTRTDFYSSLQADQQKPFNPKQLTEENLAEKIRRFADLRDRYVDSAQDILSEYQLEQFSQSVEQWYAMQKAGLRMSLKWSEDTEGGDRTDPDPDVAP